MSNESINEGFWAAAAEGRLVIQRCDGCAEYRHYPQPRCPQCLSEAWTWTEVSGRGTVYTFTVTHQPFHPDWAGRVPYAVATIELAEGVRVVSDLPTGDEERVTIGAEVELYFDDTPLPKFRLVTPEPGSSSNTRP